MASQHPGLRKQAEHIQSEHHELLQRLAELDGALNALVCYSEVYADLSSAAEVCRTMRWISGWLPDHFEREEKGVLAAVARLRPDLAAFAREMKRQHKEIGLRLRDLCKVVDQLQTSDDLEQSIFALKEQGKDWARSMSLHMGAEERKLSGLSA